MLAFSFGVLVWCQALALSVGIEEGAVITFFTHPETLWPMKSGLVHRATVVTSSNDNDVIMQRYRGASRAASAKGVILDEACGNLSLLFRTYDGSCNHRYNLGQSMQPLARLLAPQYQDGVQAPRRLSVLGGELPGPRDVSRLVHTDVRGVNPLTIYVMQWGQFMDHEIVSTPLPVEDTRGVVECCGPNDSPPSGTENSECFPIIFQSPDPNFLGTCMSLVRSMPIRDDDGNIVFPRENINAITPFVDASNVYGSSEERMEELRDPTHRHLLKTTPDNFMPDSGLDDCVKRNSSDFCFRAGDDRANEQPALTLMHTVFVRYHNKLAQVFRLLDPLSSDDTIFQRTRAFVGAVMQKILYRDWLPLFLGPDILHKYGLDLDKRVGKGKNGTKRKAGFSRYDPDLDPRIFTAFSTAVFRLGHSLIPRSLPLSPGRRRPLRELFFKPFLVREHLDTLTSGLAQALDVEDLSQPLDRHVVEEVTGHLFENQEGEKQGFDLMSVNIQRGRDHGLPSYNAFRQAVGLTVVANFSDPVLGDAGPLFGQLYRHVDDIELFSGGMSEPGHNGGLAGRTFSELMGLQFSRLMAGDRFFYTHRRRPYGFTLGQIRKINRVSLAKILCMTTSVTSIQPDVFRPPNDGMNRPKSCIKLKLGHPDLRHFKIYPL